MKASNVPDKAVGVQRMVRWMFVAEVNLCLTAFWFLMVGALAPNPQCWTPLCGAIALALAAWIIGVARRFITSNAPHEPRRE